PVVRDRQSGWPGVLRPVRHAVDSRRLRACQLVADRRQASKQHVVPSSRRTALIFAGGRATRLGGVNKALLDIGGKPIIRRILDALGPLADEQVLLTNDASLRGRPGLRLVFDPQPHAGVLPALAAGLSAASGE